MSLSWFSCGSSILVELEFGVLLFVKEENQRTWSKTLGARTTVPSSGTSLIMQWVTLDSDLYLGRC